MNRIISFGIRLTSLERDALKRAAASDQRATSALARKILLEWLQAGDWLKDQAPTNSRPANAKKAVQ